MASHTTVNTAVPAPINHATTNATTPSKTGKYSVSVTACPNPRILRGVLPCALCRWSLRSVWTARRQQMWNSPTHSRWTPTCLVRAAVGPERIQCARWALLSLSDALHWAVCFYRLKTHLETLFSFWNISLQSLLFFNNSLLIQSQSQMQANGKVSER